MKASTIFSLCSLGVACCDAQPTIVKNDAVQVLYVGVENPVTVRVDFTKPGDVNVAVSTGYIRSSNDNGGYLWRLCDSRDTVAYIRVYQQGDLVDSVRFPVKRIGNPYVSSGFHSCRSSRSLRDTRGLMAELGDFPSVFKMRFEVLRYRVFLSSPRGNMEATNTGAVFGTEVRRILESARPGDFVFIDNIFVQVGCEPRPRRCPEMVFSIH